MVSPFIRNMRVVQKQTKIDEENPAWENHNLFISHYSSFDPVSRVIIPVKSKTRSFRREKKSKPFINKILSFEFPIPSLIIFFSLKVFL